MDSVTIVPELQPKGRLGLIIGIIDDKVYNYHYATVPSIGKELGSSLADILNTPLEQGFTMKNWIVEHANQTNKMVSNCFSIVGIFTTGNEQIIDKKTMNPVCAEICELLKKINKIVKNKLLIHLHFATNENAVRIVDFQANKNFVGKIVNCEFPHLIDINCKIPIWLELDHNSAKNSDEILRMWKEFVEKLEIRFKAVDKSNKIFLDPVVQVYSSEIGKISKNCEVRIKGIIESRIKIIKGASVSQAAALIKSDIYSSLFHRYSIIKNTGNNFQLPRRVFADNNISLCDYLEPLETTESSIQRFQSILGIIIEKLNSSETIYSNPSPLPSPSSSSKYLVFVLIPLILALFLKLIY